MLTLSQLSYNIYKYYDSIDTLTDLLNEINGVDNCEGTNPDKELILETLEKIEYSISVYTNKYRELENNINYLNQCYNLT